MIAKIKMNYCVVENVVMVSKAMNNVYGFSILFDSVSTLMVHSTGNFFRVMVKK